MAKYYLVNTYAYRFRRLSIWHPSRPQNSWPWHGEAQYHGKGQIHVHKAYIFLDPKLLLILTNADFEREQL